VFIFCFYFVSAKLQTDGTIAPAKPLPSAFWRQNRHCLFFSWSIKSYKWSEICHNTKSDPTCTYRPNMLATFPLTTARDKCWWSHCRSLGSPNISASFFERQLNKRVVDGTM